MVESSRIAVAAGATLLGFLAVLATTQPQRETREIRRLELADLIQAEDARVRALRQELQGLRGELDRLREEAGATGEAVGRLNARADALGLAAGTRALQGDGIVVVLDDSSAARSPTGDPNDLVVHERDIQTVVNALWAAGAEAVSIDGERLAPTSAVRCAGNTLLLHGTVHSPPYEVAAIGDAERMGAILERQPGMDRLRSAAESFGLGLDVRDAVVSMGGAPVPAVRLATPGRA